MTLSNIDSGYMIQLYLARGSSEAVATAMISLSPASAACDSHDCAEKLLPGRLVICSTAVRFAADSSRPWGGDIRCIRRGVAGE